MSSINKVSIDGGTTFYDIEDTTARQLIDDTVGWVGKNRLPLTLEGMKANNTSGTWSGNTYTRNGATFVFNIDADGNVLSINATAGSNIQTMSLNFSLPAGNYILSSGFTESYGNNDTLLTKNNTVIARGNTRDPGRAFSLNETSDLVWNIRINSGSYTAYPMIQRADDLDPTFVPYHPSVEESKADNTVIAPVEDGTTCKNPNGYTAGQHFINDGGFCTATTTIAYGETLTEGTNYTKGNVASSLIYTKEKQVTMNTLSFVDTGNSSKYALLDFNSDLPQGAKILTAIICEPWQGRAEPFPSIAINSTNRGIHLVVPRDVTYGEYYLTFRVLYTF